MRPRFSVPVLGTAVSAALLLGTPAPAAAAEAGAARVMAGASTVTPVGNCLARASSGGTYGISCAGVRSRLSFLALLAGAPVPTCWLVSPGSSDDTPATTGATSGSAAVQVLTTVATPEPLPTAEPTVQPTGSPTTPVPAAPTATATPTGTASATPTETVLPTQLPTETETPTPTRRPPATWIQVTLSPAPDPVTGVPVWGIDLLRTTVEVSVDDVDRCPLWSELTDGQRAYADLADRREGTIQTNGLTVSPSSTPRIGQTVAFSVRNVVDPPVVVRGQARMRARALSLTVWPVPGGDPITCTGTGERVGAQDTVRSGETICSWTYRQTSAGYTAAGVPDTFAVRGISRWQIEMSQDDGASWSPVVVAEVDADLGVRVSEVQTLVVPIPVD